MSAVIPCGQPRKTTYPERPSCKHGPMVPNGIGWVCSKRRKTRKRAKLTPEQRERKNAQQRKLAEAKLADGLCIRCDQPYVGTSRYCLAHLARHQEADRRYNIRNENKEN